MKTTKNVNSSMVSVVSLSCQTRAKNTSALPVRSTKARPAWGKLLLGFLVFLNITLGVVYAVGVNQAAISGYRLARLQAQQGKLLEARQKNSVKLAQMTAESAGSVFFSGFERVNATEYLPVSDQVSVR